MWISQFDGTPIIVLCIETLEKMPQFLSIAIDESIGSF